MVTITIRDEKDWKKVEKAIINVVNEETLKLYKRVQKASFRITQFILRSLRARLANAPYSSHSSRPGPWSRRGGRPSEQSLRLRQTKRTWVVYIEDQGNVRGKGVLKPSEYIHLKSKQKGTPAKYVDDAINAALKQLDKLLKQATK